MAEQLRIPPPQRFDEPSFRAQHRELNLRLQRISEVIEQLQTRSTLKGNLDASNFRLTNVGLARSDFDAVPLRQLSSEFDRLRDELFAALTSEASVGQTNPGNETSQGGGDSGDTPQGTITIEYNGVEVLVDASAINFSDPDSTALVVDDGDGTVTIDLSQYAIGNAAAGQVAYWTGTSTIAGDTALTYDATTDTLTLGVPDTSFGTLSGSETGGPASGLLLNTSPGTVIGPGLEGVFYNSTKTSLTGGMLTAGFFQTLDIDGSAATPAILGLIIGAVTSVWTIVDDTNPLAQIIIQHVPTIQNTAGMSQNLGSAAGLLQAAPIFLADAGVCTVPVWMGMDIFPAFTTANGGTIEVDDLRGIDVAPTADSGVTVDATSGFRYLAPTGAGSVGLDVAFSCLSTYGTPPTGECSSFKSVDPARFMRHVGSAVFGADANPSNASVGVEIQSIELALLLSRLTDAEETALTPLDGMMIYNTDQPAFRGYLNGAWVSFTTADDVTGDVTITGKLTVTGDIDPTRVLLSGVDKRFGATDAGPVYLAPFADATSGVQVRKADDTTVIVNVDTTNARVGVGTSMPEVDVHVKKDAVASIRATTFHATQNPLLSTERGLGTEASPAAVTSGTTLFQMLGRGQFTTTLGDIASGFSWTVEASENWGAGARGSNVRVFNVRTGTTALAEIARFGANGGVVFGDAGVTPAARVHAREGTTLGAEVFRAESVATNDDPNYRVFQNRVATTDATVTTLHSVTIAASNTYLIEARVVARRTGGSAGTAEDGAGYVVRATVKNVAGTATLIDAVVVADYAAESQVAWDCTIDVNAATARVRVTGAVNNNIVWHTTVIVQNVGT